MKLKKTKDDLGGIIASYNKLAKHYRNLELKAGVGTKESYLFKDLKLKAYQDKDKLLDTVAPVLIHRQKREKEYVLSISENDNLYDMVSDDTIIGEGEYLDKELNRVFKYKKVKLTKTLNSYSLYYAIDGYRFHKPIAQDEYYKKENILKLVDENELKAKYNLEIKDYK